MNMLANIFSDNFIHAFGWTLLHSLWQGALVALIYAATMLILKKGSSRLRYWVSLIALMIIPVMFLLTFISIYPEKEAVAVTNMDPVTVINGPVDAELIKTYLLERKPAGFFKDLFYTSVLYFEKNMPLLVLLWMMGLMIFSIRFLGGLAYTQRLKHHKTYAVSEEWELYLKQMARKMKVSRPVTMFESALIKMPMVIGFFKPVILMPLGALSTIPADQLEAIISHELAHILRKDYIINIIQSVIEVFFFFHPAVWWISKNIRIEREYNCDDLTLKFYDDPLIYVKALANIKEMETNNEFTRFASAFSNGKDQLLDRIQRMVNKPRIKSGFTEGVILIVFLVFSVLTITTTAAISMREDNFDPFLNGNSSNELPENHAKSEQPLNIEIYPITNNEVAFSNDVIHPTVIDSDDQKDIMNDLQTNTNVSKMTALSDWYLQQKQKQLILPDTNDKSKDEAYKQIQMEYEEALKLKEKAEFEMQEAMKAQQEAMEEYRKVIMEQQEMIREQHKAAKEEYQQKLKEIYKNDTLQPEGRDLVEDLRFDVDVDMDYDFDYEALEDMKGVWNLKDIDEDVLFYATPGAWTIYGDSVMELNDFYFDEPNFHYKNWYDSDSGYMNWVLNGDSMNFYRYGAFPQADQDGNIFIYDEYLDQLSINNELLADELIEMNAGYRAINLDREHLLLENLQRAEDLAFFDEDEFPRGVYVPHTGNIMIPETPDLGLIYAPFKVEKIFKSELLKDDLIERGEDYIVEINSRSLIINGEKQPREVYKKYKRLLESATGDEIEDSRTFMF